jgi:lysophospholipase L1-like esterase
MLLPFIVGHVSRVSARRVRFRASLLQAAAIAGMSLLPACGGSPSQPSPPTPPAPTLTCPADVQALSHDGQPVAVTYTVPTAVNGTTPVTVACAPASGASFNLGANTVTCTATDAAARTASCTFGVTVARVPVIQRVKFLAFGDSVTEGTISSPCSTSNLEEDVLWMKLAVVEPQSYPYKLQAMLASRYVDQTIVVTNEGKAGEKATDALSRLKRVLDSVEPEVLLLLEGFNDMLAAGKADDFGAVIPEVAGALEEMVKAGRSHKASVLLATLPAGNPTGCRGAGAPGFPALNDRIRRVAADEGATLVDLYNGLGRSPEGVIGIDGLHPTEDGYTKVAQVWFDAIKARFEQPSPTSAGSPVLVMPPQDRFP